MPVIKYYLCGGEKPKSEYPLGLGYLKAFCGGEIVADKSELVDCDMIGLSSNDHGINEAIDILNSTDIPVVIGGQVSMWPGLSRYPFKYIVKGEGELPLRDIMDGKDPVERQIDDIDSLPFPDRGKCDKVAPILTSRGCPYSCYFCSSTRYWSGVRWHSPERIIDEVRDIKQNHPGVVSISIMDDLFTSNKKRLRRLHKIWPFNLSMEGFVRSNTFDEETGNIMKDMGFRSIRFGAESGSNSMLKRINKKATVEDHQRAIDIGNKIGLEVQASFIRNLPGETEQDRKETDEFQRKNKGKFRIVGNYDFKAFSGTPYYNGEDITKMDMAVR